jgi:hypothetical protein
MEYIAITTLGESGKSKFSIWFEFQLHLTQSIQMNTQMLLFFGGPIDGNMFVKIWFPITMKWAPIFYPSLAILRCE